METSVNEDRRILLTWKEGEEPFLFVGQEATTEVNTVFWHFTLRDLNLSRIHLNEKLFYVSKRQYKRARKLL
jgi:hypothetical protein